VIKVLAETDVPVEDEMAFKALKLILQKQLMAEQETLVLEAIRKTSKEEDKLADLLRVVQMQGGAFPRVRVYLLKKKGEYSKALAIYMNSSALRGDVFEWVNEVLEKLEKD